MPLRVPETVSLPQPSAMTTMQYRRLGASGLKLSALSFGSWVTFGTQVDEAPRSS